jgi:hypothetical protein
LRRRTVRFGNKRVGLEHDAESARAGGSVGDVSAADTRFLPSLCGIEPGDRAQQGRLAAAGGPEKADELTLRDIEVDVLERRERAEPLFEVADAQEWRCGLMTHEPLPAASQVSRAQCSME